MSEDKLIIGDIVEVNASAVEPKDYFKVLKDSVNTRTDVVELQNQLNIIARTIKGAESLGQNVFLDKLKFTAETIIKEQMLYVNSYRDYVYKDNISDFITKVIPKHSVKMIDLENYPRAIPLSNMEDIIHAKSLNIFDKFLVVFTDLTDIDHRSDEQKKFLLDNRDPIVFGYFQLDKTTHTHERLYMITDWEDEYCELTYERMLDKMSKMGITDGHTIDPSDVSYLTDLTNSVTSKINAPSATTLSFYDRLKQWMSK